MPRSTMRTDEQISLKTRQQQQHWILWNHITLSYLVRRVQTKHDRRQRRKKPPILRVRDHNEEIGTNEARKTNFIGISWSSAKKCRRGKDKERKGIVREYKQFKTQESGSYCKSNSNARETQNHRSKPEK